MKTMIQNENFSIDLTILDNLYHVTTEIVPKLIRNDVQS